MFSGADRYRVPSGGVGPQLPSPGMRGGAQPPGYRGTTGDQTQPPPPGYRGSTTGGQTQPPPPGYRSMPRTAPQDPLNHRSGQHYGGGWEEGSEYLLQQRGYRSSVPESNI